MSDIKTGDEHTDQLIRDVANHATGHVSALQECGQTIAALRARVAEVEADASRFAWLVEQVGYDADFNCIANRSEEFGYEVGIYHSDDRRDVYGSGASLRLAVDAARDAAKKALGEEGA